MTLRWTPRSAKPGLRIPTARLRKSARKLFACALETPGGLKVQTIHALCTRLLQQFPFEANVPARFAVLDDRDQNEMMERANLGVFLEASRNPDSATGRALHDGDGERRRRHLQGCGPRGLSQPRSFHGLDRRRRQRACGRGANLRGAWRRSRRSHRGCRARDRRRTEPAAIALAGHRVGSGYRQQVRSGPGGAAARGADVHRRSAGRCLSRRLPHRNRPHAAQIGGDEEIFRQQSRRSAGCSNRKRSASAP